MATFSIQSSPVGSQFVENISDSEPADLNDFDVFITSDENVTLTESDVSVSSGSSIVAFSGSNASYKATIRPPETSGTVTVEIAANAVPEGNPAVSQDIRVSTSFPDADAEEPTTLFSFATGTPSGIAVSPTRILLNISSTVEFYTHDGTEQTSEALIINTGVLDYFNESFIRGRSRYPLNSTTAIATYNGLSSPIVHTAIGLLEYPRVFSAPFRYLPYGTTDSADIQELNTVSGFHRINKMAHQDGLLFLTTHLNGSPSSPRDPVLARLTDEPQVEIIKRLNIKRLDTTSFNPNDLAIYKDKLYITESQKVTTLDIRPYRPLSLNTKTTIPVQFANEGDTIDLTQFCPDADTIIFGLGFDKPSYLSINADNELVIASDAVSETTPVFVKLTGINFIDSIDFEFYLVIQQATSPTWRDVESLSMKANTTYDLHQIVDADSIAFEPGETQPTGSSLSDGVFTIATTAGTAYFRATKDGLTTDKAIQIDVIQPPDPDNFSDVFRYKVEIGGIDVSSDLIKNTPLRVTKSLDDVELSRYRAHSVTVPLRDIEGKYSPDLAGNFWETNNLNAGGYQEEIKVYRESFISGAWVESLLFVGVIEQQAEQFSAVQVNITAKDISVELERSFISNFGTLEKWDSLRQQSDEATFEGVYVPEGSLLPIQPEVAKAWSDRTELTLRRLQLPTKGPPLSNTGYLTASDFRTSGGFLQTPPILNAKTLPRSEDVTFLFDQLALTESVYNTDIQLPAVVLDTPTVFNRGSVPFSVEDTRITRLITDWVHDATNDRLLMPLSNPEGHVADLLVQYNVESDNFRTLYTFDKDVKVHRIERRNGNNYYILTSSAITQDRSALTLPRTVDKTGYAYDSTAEGSLIRIHHYNASTNTLTEHVAEDDDRPPQLGIHYAVGFENDLYIDEFEGIVADSRGAFKWHSNNLYYRYATDSEFGVARVNAGGTTSEMIDQATGPYHNHLNFAFDITSGGDIYFVYATGDDDESSLVIKRRTSGGTESTRLTETEDVDALTVIDAQGGVFLGCYEALFYDDDLYMLCPIGRVDYDEDDDETTRSRTKASGMALYRCNVTDSSPTLTTIETWDFATRGGCNLVLHDAAVYFMEHPPASTIYRFPYNPDLDTYNESMGYNVLPEALGALKKVESDGSVESLGNLWYDSDRPYNVAGARALSFDDELHVTMGYGNANEVLRYNSLASKADNFVHLVFGNRLKYIIPAFQPTGNVYSKLSELARQVGATVSFDGNIISVVDRRPYRAKTDGATGTGTGNLDVDSENKDFPSSGYLRIGDEFIGYTGISSGAFTGITRGALRSEPVSHSDNTGILYVNALFSEREILHISPSTDTSRHHNIIRDSENAFEVPDDDSIAQYRKQPYTLDLGLTRNEDAWIEFIFAEYLSELKNLGTLMTLQLRPQKKSFALDLGQFIGLRHGSVAYVLRIELIDYHRNSVEIKGRSVETTL